MTKNSIVKIEKWKLTWFWYYAGLIGMLITPFYPHFTVYYPTFLAFIGAFYMNGVYSVD